MSSRSSSSSRATVVHLSCKETRTFPITPQNTEESTLQTLTTDSDTSPTPTVRERRGRRNVTNSSFRPLSVFTKNMLTPLVQNVDEAFEVLKGDSPDRLEIVSGLLSSKKEEKSETTDTNRETTSDRSPADQESFRVMSREQRTLFADGRQTLGHACGKEAITPQRPVPGSVTLRGRPTTGFGMDLMTALKVTSPEKDEDDPLSSDFTTLCQLPIPDPSEHPAFAAKPFEVKTEAPLLCTSSSAAQIRACKAEKPGCHGYFNSIGEKSVERKKSLFGLGFSTPSSLSSRNAFSSSEDSPLPIVIPVSNSNSAQSSVKDVSPVMTEPSQSRERSGTDKSNGIRKLSDIFKRKDSLEKGDFKSPQWSPRMSLESPKERREEMERSLRRSTHTPVFSVDPLYPRHPNTGRGWKSRNLKCTTCSLVDCAICHRVCCAYRAAVLALDNYSDSSPGRPLALERIQDITKLYPYGRESPTFLQCTVDIMDDSKGCGRMVCPDCCSICPDDACADTACRRCKPIMWEECGWHKDGVLVKENGLGPSNITQHSQMK